MKKNNFTLILKCSCLFFMLFVAFLSSAQEAPVPKDTPAEYAEKSGPPPPPDASIDAWIVPMLIVAILFVGYRFYKYRLISNRNN